MILETSNSKFMSTRSKIKVTGNKNV